jgi:predicted SAM-dependent methyltransferase
MERGSKQRLSNSPAEMLAMPGIQNAFRLHIGGREIRDGWKILNIQPGEGVDFVGDIQDLSQFADESCNEIYGSHVLEHISQARMVPTLKGFHRILKRGGRLMISVPDLEVLCKLFVRPQLDVLARFHIMRMMFGGQTDAADFHHIGLTFEFLSEYMGAAGFSRMERVAGFNLFNDTSSFAPYDNVPISLNVIVYKD